MHELALAESTLEIALATAREADAKHIDTLTMRVGPLSGVVDEALEFALSSLVQGTMAEGAELAIEHVPLVCYCAHCKKEFESHKLSYRCPACGVVSKDVRQGREMELVSIEVT